MHDFMSNVIFRALVCRGVPTESAATKLIGNMMIGEELKMLPNIDNSGKARGPGRKGEPGSCYSCPKPPTIRESHKLGPPLEPGPLAPCPFQRGAMKGGPGRKGGVPARRGVGVPACGVLWPVRGQEAWEYHEPGPPNEPGPLAFSQQFRLFPRQVELNLCTALFLHSSI